MHVVIRNTRILITWKQVHPKNLLLKKGDLEVLRKTCEKHSKHDFMFPDLPRGFFIHRLAELLSKF